MTVANQYAEKFKKVALVVDGDLSDDLISDPVEVNHLKSASFELAWDGDAAGDFSVEVSNTGEEDSWTALPLTDQISAEGAPGTAQIDVPVGADKVRLVYAKTSGSGELQCTVVVK